MMVFFYLLFFMIRRPPKSTRTDTLFPTRRSSDLANGTVFHTWIYDRISLDIRGLKAGGSNWNNSINLRVGSGGSEETVDWDGCIEERKTVSRSSYDPIPTEAMDLNIDLVPDRTDQDTLWGPAQIGRASGRERVCQDV